MKLNYKIAGVDRDAAEAAVKKIGQLAKRTFTNGVLGDIGHFGAFFEIPISSYKQPVLVSSVDGVGTKIKIACAMNRYRGIGHDLVNHCLNDIMCSGAQPLYFLDYLSLGKIEGSAVLELASGLADACQENGCALIGGETAEMPDIYEPGEFDIAGTAVGIVEKAMIIDGSRVQTGDVLIGLTSTGLHTNGFTLARKIVELSSNSSYHKHYDRLGATIGETLLAQHRSYRQAIESVRTLPETHGIAHITGGGIAGNTQRLLQPGQRLAIDWQAWRWPEIFVLLQALGEVEVEEMRRVFNLGMGLVFIVDKRAEDRILALLRGIGEQPTVIGNITTN